jgi:hypothetical protein
MLTEDELHLFVLIEELHLYSVLEDNINHASTNIWKGVEDWLEKS